MSAPRPEAASAGTRYVNVYKRHRGDVFVGNLLASRGESEQVARYEQKYLGSRTLYRLVIYPKPGVVIHD